MFLLPSDKKLILASKSPRRQQLLSDLGYSFEVRAKEVDESHEPNLNGQEIAEFLASKKARAFKAELEENEILLSSDTVVWCKDESLAKAGSEEEAKSMLRKISGDSHQVITGVCLISKQHEIVFSDTTTVFFKVLTEDEIQYYVDHFKPFDKAGAYGIQEWIGMHGIEKIEGSYFTVMGLPTHLIGPMLHKFTTS